MMLGLTPRMLIVATLCGVALGFAYTLSPLTVWFLFGFAFLCRAAVRDLSAEERRVVLTLLIVATALRLAVVAGLFLATDHHASPFGSLFGDEEYFKRRSLWMRSMALNVDISIADQLYAIDEYSDTSYLYILAFLQILVGSAPYGVHLLGIAAYLAAAVVIYRFMRRTFGQSPAVLSFVGLLFYPSLFLWSVSALRESLHLLLTATALIGGIEIVRAGRPWRTRAAWAITTIVSWAALRDLRVGSMKTAMAATLLGLAAALIPRHLRKWAIVAGAAALVAIAIAEPHLREWPMTVIRQNALNHQGHVFTPGLHYKLLDAKYYFERSLDMMDAMTLPEAARFVSRALVALVVVPLPWQADTAFVLAYLPEQIIWYLVVALFPVGVWVGRRIDPAATYVFTTYIAIMGVGIALRSGNVGTLIRHRGFLLPFMICLGAVAVCHLLTHAARKDAVHAYH